MAQRPFDVRGQQHRPVLPVDLPVLHLLPGGQGSVKQRPRDADLEPVYRSDRVYHYRQKAVFENRQDLPGGADQHDYVRDDLLLPYHDAECDELVVLSLGGGRPAMRPGEMGAWSGCLWDRYNR